MGEKIFCDKHIDFSSGQDVLFTQYDKGEQGNMNKERDEVEKYFEYCIARYINSKKVMEEIQRDCYDKYQMPFNRTKGILSLEYASVELSEPEMFWILDCINSSERKVNLGDIFTPIEIENYRQMKYNKAIVTFPIEIDCLKVNEQQWIGVIDAQTLVLWRGTIMRYNKDIQRRLQCKVYGGLTYETVLPRLAQVAEIVQALKNGKFIANDISINIYDDAEFYFDNDRKKMIINKVDHFDLTDGYSRLLALSKVIDEDPNFDFNMELRIQNFTEDWASMFINQQTKQVPIPKKDADTYDMTDMANKITKKINTMLSDCLLAGHITRGGRVDFGTFSRMLSECILKHLSETEKALALINVTNDVIQSINTLVASEPRLLDVKMTTAEIRVMVYCAGKCFKEDKSNIAELYRYYLSAVSSEQKDTLATATEKKVLSLLNSFGR